MYWVPLLAGVLNAGFILDLLVTISTGDSLAKLLCDVSGNTVATKVVDSIPTDPAVFWIAAGFVLFFVCAIECLVIYIAFYSDIERCRCPDKPRFRLFKEGRQ